MKAADIMTREVITVAPGTPVPTIARLMRDHGVSGLPVVDEEGVLLGLVTEKDLIARNARVHFPTFINILGAVVAVEVPHFRRDIEHFLAATAEELMSKNVGTVHPDTPLEDVATLMVERGYNPVPVVDGAGRVVGIISRSDLVALMARAEGGDA